jgi:hypothetical protein
MDTITKASFIYTFVGAPKKEEKKPPAPPPGP